MNYDKREAVALTQQLVQIESSNPGTYECAVADFIYNWFEEEGISVSRATVLPGRDNIIAKLEGAIDMPNLVYVCHMDTVPVGNGWDNTSLDAEIINNKLYGRGSCDMKAGLAASMIAFRNIAREKHSLKHQFLFVATVDEEDLMLGAEQMVHSGLVTADSWVLDAEPTNGAIQVAHKGKTWFRLTAKGVAAHASTPWKGSDAIAAMAEIMSIIREKISYCPSDAELGFSTVTFGTISGGSSTNIVPELCSLCIDMRLVPPITSELSISLVEEAITEGLKRVIGVTCEYEILATRPYVNKDSQSYLLAKLLQAAGTVMGDSPPVGFFPGYTDTAVISALTGNNNCMSFGPGDLSLAHKPDEYVPCDEILRAEEIMTLLAKNILY